jgi:ABC-type multidrug transport system fused ATPase/permease subunit
MADENAEEEGTEKSLRTAPLRRLLALARPELPRLAFGTLFLIIGALTGLLVPQLFQLILDRAIGKGNPAWTIDRAALALVGLAALQATSTALRFALFTGAGERRHAIA